MTHFSFKNIVYNSPTFKKYAAFTFELHDDDQEDDLLETIFESNDVYNHIDRECIIININIDKRNIKYIVPEIKFIDTPNYCIYKKNSNKQKCKIFELQFDIEDEFESQFDIEDGVYYVRDIALPISLKLIEGWDSDDSQN